MDGQLMALPVLPGRGGMEKAPGQDELNDSLRRTACVTRINLSQAISNGASENPEP